MQSNPIANCLRNNQSHCHRDFIDVFLLRFVCLFVCFFVAGLDIAKICMFLGLHCIFFFCLTMVLEKFWHFSRYVHQSFVLAFVYFNFLMIEFVTYEGLIKYFISRVCFIFSKIILYFSCQGRYKLSGSIRQREGMVTQ